DRGRAGVIIGRRDIVPGEDRQRDVIDFHGVVPSRLAGSKRSIARAAARVSQPRIGPPTPDPAGPPLTASPAARCASACDIRVIPGVTALRGVTAPLCA